MSEVTAVHWGWVKKGRWEPNPKKPQHWLEVYVQTSIRCDAGSTCQGWVYKVSDGRWVGVTARPRVIKFYATEEAAITAIVLQGE